MLDGVLQCQDAALALNPVANVAVYLVHDHHDLGAARKQLRPIFEPLGVVQVTMSRGPVEHEHFAVKQCRRLTVLALDTHAAFKPSHINHIVKFLTS